MTSPIYFSTAGNTRLLSVDTSSMNGSVALATGRSSPSQYAWDKKSTHSECATIETQRLLKDAGLTFKSLTHLSVNVGPGSFTGIRVGLNLVRTLAYTLSLPVAVFNTLEVLASQHSQPGDSVLVATKAVQNFFYVAAYKHSEHGLVESLAPTSMSQFELESVKSTHTKVLIEGLTSGLRSHTEAIEQIDWISKWPQTVRFFQWHKVNPLYIRGSEAEEKMRRGLLRPL